MIFVLLICSCATGTLTSEDGRHSYFAPNIDTSEPLQTENYNSINKTKPTEKYQFEYYRECYREGDPKGFFSILTEAEEGTSIKFKSDAKQHRTLWLVAKKNSNEIIAFCYNTIFKVEAESVNDLKEEIQKHEKELLGNDVYYDLLKGCIRVPDPTMLKVLNESKDYTNQIILLAEPSFPYDFTFWGQNGGELLRGNTNASDSGYGQPNLNMFSNNGNDEKRTIIPVIDTGLIPERRIIWDF